MIFQKACVVILILFFYLINESLCYPKVESYLKEREELIRKSEQHAIGGNLTLDEDEKEANRILMKYKNEEFEEGFKNSDNFAAGQHFFKAKPYIKESYVFKIIQRLPKAASLHSHDTALVSDKYVFKNITYRENLYAKDNKTDPIALKFFKKDPGTPWKPMRQWRNSDETFDVRLEQQMTLVVENPEVVYPNVTAVWNTFQNMFFTIEPLLTYKPVFRDYFYQALKELYEDNIRYLEFRGILPELYDLDGNTYGPEDVVKLYYETSRDFMKNHPDFWGVKLIFAPIRFTTIDVVEGYVDFMKKMIARYPKFIAGFDLVGREDTGPPLIDFIAPLQNMKAITKLFFHAGETLWNGLPADLNLFDAILLNTTRIGHGYAVLKHPEILRIIREKNIAFEIAPISNQVLGLVKDLRNHPANFLIANNYPVVIAPDDPGFWGARAVSYDWYYAFMGMASRHSDLRLLKQLAINSIVYSSMDDELKQKAMEKWKQDWRTFLKTIIRGELACCNCRKKK